MDPASFAHDYSKILVHAWTDKSFLDQLLSDTAAVVTANGLPVQAGGTVTVDRSIGGEPDLQQQIDLWTQGEQSGQYTLYVPEAPQLGMESSSGAGDLAADTYCCCCCPCCTCT